MNSIARPGIVILSLLLACPLTFQSALADSKWAVGERHDRDERPQKHNKNKRVIILKKPQWRERRAPGYPGHPAVVVPRDRFFWGIHVFRRHGHPYHGYGFFYSDNDAFKWLAFTAITLVLLDNLNEEQQRLHESAQVRATTADIGEPIVWEDGGASGSVTTTRIGTSSSGRQCREFRQRVTIGGKSEEAYGTACMNPDGSWEIVPQ